jgi:hypothetical protein
MVKRAGATIPWWSLLWNGSTEPKSSVTKSGRSINQAISSSFVDRIDEQNGWCHDRARRSWVRLERIDVT